MIKIHKIIISLSIILIGSIIANTSHAWTQDGKFRDWGVAVNGKNCAAWTASKRSKTQAEIIVLFDKGQNTANIHFKIPDLQSKYQLKKVKLEVLGAKYDYQLNMTEANIASSTPVNIKSIISAFRKGSDVKSNWSINDGKNRSSSFSLMGFTAAFLKAAEKCGAEKFALTTAPGNQANTKKVSSNNKLIPKNTEKLNLFDIKTDTRDHQEIIKPFLKTKDSLGGDIRKSNYIPMCAERRNTPGSWCTDTISFSWGSEACGICINNTFHLMLGANLALYDLTFTDRDTFPNFKKSNIIWELDNKKLTVILEGGSTLVLDIAAREGLNSTDLLFDSKIYRLSYGDRYIFNKRLIEINNRRQSLYKAYLIEEEKKEKLNLVKQAFLKLDEANQINVLNKLTETTSFKFTKNDQWDDDVINAITQYSREFIFKDDKLELPPKIEDVHNLFELIINPKKQLSEYNKNILEEILEKLERKKKVEQASLVRWQKAEQEKLEREKKVRDEFSEKLKAHELKLNDKNIVGFRDFYIGMDNNIHTYVENGEVTIKKIKFKNKDGEKCTRISKVKPIGLSCYGLDYRFKFEYTKSELNKIRVYVLNYVQSSSYIGNLFNMGTSEDPVVNLINSLNKKYSKSYSYSENERLLFNDGETDELYLAYEDGQVILSLERVEDGLYDTDIYVYITYRNKSDGLKFLDTIKPKTASSDF